MARTGGDSARTVLRFGVFEFDGRTGELRKHGVKLKLRGKPLQVLQALLEEPGEIVARETLQARLWPSDVFVDFESGLNTAANRLRIVLGDSAESPRYIETLPRVGYRFIAPVEEAAKEAASRDERPRLFRGTRVFAASAALLTLLLTSWFALRRPAPVAFEFRQVTFRHGQIWGARFAPDAKSILYTASWDNGPRRLFLTYPSSPESRPLGFEDLRLVAASSTGELALLSFDGTPVAGGTLSRVAMNGGAPSPVERNVMSADWAPGTDRLAIVHAVDGTNRLEFPIGTVVTTTSGWLSGVRISPRGDRIAFVEHPVRNDNRGSVKITDLAGNVQTLSGEWTSVGGIAWHPSGEIWFTAARDGAPKSLWAVSPSGSFRPVTQIAGAMTLRDISSEGSLLVSRDTTLLELAAVVEGKQRNLTWLDWSRVADVSADGTVVLFDEEGVAAGAEYVIYVHQLGEGSTMRVGEGTAMALSPDGQAVLAGGTRDRSRLRLLPLGHGGIRDLPPTGLEYQWVRFFPDGHRLLALASEPGQPLRLYVLAIDGGKPIAITPPTVTRTAAVSPDGSQIALLTANGKFMIYPSDGGPGRVVSTEGVLGPLLWSADDWIYVQHLGAYTQIPTRLSRFHLPTGRLETWTDVRPADTLGVNAITKVMMSQNTRTVVFNYRRALSELFVAIPSAR
jgi:DNA-binding winged helix-turn-helix (wHTH) protein/WD40 repeat protein